MPPSGERLNGVAMFGERPELIPVRGATWEDLDLVVNERYFLADPQRFLRHLRE